MGTESMIQIFAETLNDLLKEFRNTPYTNTARREIEETISQALCDAAQLFRSVKIPRVQVAAKEIDVLVCEWCRQTYSSDHQGGCTQPGCGGDHLFPDKREDGTTIVVSFFDPDTGEVIPPEKLGEVLTRA